MKIDFCIKFVFDRMVSLIGFILLSPFLLAIAISVKRESPKMPIIFKQERVGRNGKCFTMYKFRTMIENHGGPSVSIKGESRITPLGAKLRRLKLDELPELWNVFIGNMSFVGPRPDVPGYADKLEGEDREILSLRPGITGLATLKYRNEEELLSKVNNPIEYNDKVIFPDKVSINLKYLHHYSFFLDIKILWCTVTGKKLNIFNN